MASSKPLSKQDILRAMKMTKSNMAAARYLNVSYNHYRMFAKMYFNKDGKSLFEEHKNESGKGIPKFLKNSPNLPNLEQILSGELWINDYSVEDFKTQLLNEHILVEECNRCGFNERRVADYKSPILLSFKDGNKKNWKKENLELLCYNCYYLTVGEVFTKEEINSLEEYTSEELIPDDKLDFRNIENHFNNLDIEDDFRDYS